MHTWLLVAGLPGILLGASALAGGDVSQCAKIHGTARYSGFGYDHLVEVDNQCKRAVSCEVWTDVDPEPHHTVLVAAGETGVVKIRAGSPSREFEAQGVCKPQ